MTTIYKKLISAKKTFPEIIKNVAGFGYKYANLAQLIEAISEPLWNNNLDFYQIIKENHMITGVVDCDNGEKLELVDIEIISAAIAKATEIQALGGGLTYLRRYSLMIAFGLASEDDDGKTATNPAKKPEPKPTPAKDIQVDKVAITELFYIVKDKITDAATLAKAEALIKNGGADETWSALNIYLMKLRSS